MSVLATAGHVNHGKTTLVRVLTGVETDRLPEETRRGMSITLGFAPLHLRVQGVDRVVGLIDVPGHQKFVRTMISGVHGIDGALFLIAADEGPNKQSYEHAEILTMLGVWRGVFVVSKADCVADDRLAAVVQQVKEFRLQTSLAKAPVLQYSARSGHGVDGVRRAITELVADLPQPVTKPFRLPVDRVFSLRGRGVIATGTAIGGTVRAGDRLWSAPQGWGGVVRRVETHNAEVAAGVAGERVAINLVGKRAGDLRRGDTLCSAEALKLSVTLDVLLEMATGVDVNALRGRLRMFVGTAERQVKLRCFGAASGGQIYCRIYLDRPVACLRDDRFLLRGDKVPTWIGGGRVLAFDAGTHPVNTAVLKRELACLASDDPLASVAVYLDRSAECGRSIREVALFMNVGAEQAGQMLEGDRFRSLAAGHTTVFMTHERWTTLVNFVLRSLATQHAACPYDRGLPAASLQQSLSCRMSTQVFRAFITTLEKSSVVVRIGDVIALVDHDRRLRAHIHAMSSGIRRLIEREGLRGRPCSLSSLKDYSGVKAHLVADCIRDLEQRSHMVVLSPALVCSSRFVEVVIATLMRLFPNRPFAPSECTVALGLSRKYVIPILEYLDSANVTKRVTSGRRVVG